MSDDIKWTHRGFGRFFCYFPDDIHNEILEELYNNIDLPTYHCNKMMRDHHMYMQRFVPGSWLPLHREKTYGVLTICINDDEDWSEDNPAPNFVWYDTDCVQINKSNTDRYAVQMFFGPGFVELGTVPNDNTVGRSIPVENNDYTNTAKQQTNKALVTGYLETPGVLEMMPTMRIWEKENSEIIERLTSG